MGAMKKDFSTAALPTVRKALSCVVKAASRLPHEKVLLQDSLGRVIARPIKARLAKPSFAMASMDGYAVRHHSGLVAGSTLKVVGVAAAGKPLAKSVKAGEAVRIFTGGVVPKGADHIIIQEHVVFAGGTITLRKSQPWAQYIRPMGMDFSKGDILLAAGKRVQAYDMALLAAANCGEITVYQRPTVAIFTNGDELVETGAALKPGQVINASHITLRLLIHQWGGQALYLGCAQDNKEALRAMYQKARAAHAIVPIGGASVGDYDYVKPVFALAGGTFLFEKVNMMPGKPTWFGRLNRSCVLGLAGNPSSTLVAAVLFLKPLMEAMMGIKNIDLPLTQAYLTKAVAKNGGRESFMRAVASHHHGTLHVTPLDAQDSSLLRPFSQANCLLYRPRWGRGVSKKEKVPIVMLPSIEPA